MSRILADDDKREDYPLYDGLVAYFPAALLEIARWSKVGNDKHNPGEALHWAREKSTDHENKILRHLIDAREKTKEGFLEAVPLAWRALALLQTLLEKEGWESGSNGQWLKEHDDKEDSAQGVQDGITPFIKAALEARAENYRSPRQAAEDLLKEEGFVYNEVRRRWEGQGVGAVYITKAALDSSSNPFEFVKDLLVHWKSRGFSFKSPRASFQEETQRTEGPIEAEGADEIGAFRTLPRVEQRQVLGVPAERAQSQGQPLAAEVRSEGPSPPGVLGN